MTVDFRGCDFREWSGWRLLFLLVWAGFLTSCAAGGKGPAEHPEQIAGLHEIPGPEGVFRGHRLARCEDDLEVPPGVAGYLSICAEFFSEGSGSDGMIEMELGLEAGYRHPLMLLTLGQLYLIAGQGDPDLLPVEGPAADLGEYRLNKPRLLGRAHALLTEALDQRPDDAAIDYLLADVARASGDSHLAKKLVARAFSKCTGGRSFRILQLYQGLFEHPARYLGGPAPDYPPAAVVADISGAVVLDLLLSPAGEISQVVVVESPLRELTAAAVASHRQGQFEAAKIGKYGVWSWLRVTTNFTLSP